MPFFNYRCKNCDHNFEEFVRNLSEKVICPKCKSQEVEKSLPNRISCSASGAPGSHKDCAG